MSAAAYTEAWLSGPQQTRFYTRTYKPEQVQPNAVVVFVHGFVEHIGRYEHVFPAWSARRIGVFAFDQRGFGRTALDEENKSSDSTYAKTSWKEQLEDIEWAVNHAKQEFGGAPIFLYGHSTVGQACILMTKLFYALPLGRCIGSGIPHSDEPTSIQGRCGLPCRGRGDQSFSSSNKARCKGSAVAC